ncbi:hypothetical protein AK830_g10670 [Neonectria ditissima]|uniref:Major facilitator superfamily (MFS) profile domain-containing protein n=1 Tax=Neonectria ditissima TaxID=78410 RepID=A0A0N8H5D8_9HYPO|nr:hypothetical protein AK830_g10670 [Neonectria ditissima]
MTIQQYSEHGELRDPEKAQLENCGPEGRPEDESKCHNRPNAEASGDDDAQDGGLASSTALSSTHSIDSPPDGGLMAWSMCICAHVLMANTWGVMNSFGIFQAYYTDYFEISASKISWIGSVQSFLGFFLSIVSGRMSDAGHFRPTLVIGTALMLLGAFAMSFSTQYWQLMLSQGVAFGLGVGFLCCPMMSVASTYFSKRRSLAVGIITSGNVTGGLIYPAMARQLLPSVGFPWASRAIALMQTVTMVIVLVVAKPRVKPYKTGPMVDLSTLKELEFSWYALGGFFAYSGTFTALYYMPQFSRDGINPEFSYQDSLNILLVFNGLSVFGRIIPARLADTFGPVNLVIITTFAGGICCLGWIGVHSPGGMYAWTAIYAVVGGALLALFPAGVVSLTTDVRKAGMRLGIAFAFLAFSMLAGPPVAGAIIESAGGRYAGAQVFAGMSLVLGSLLMFGAKVARRRETGEGWTDKI